jgi:NAD(P)-dependent dehydrogenase (short-subunit alcohol dehydrogenase family)
MVKEQSDCKCLPLAADLTDPGICQTAVNRTVDEFGCIDILVLNAAVQVDSWGLLLPAIASCSIANE